MALDLENCGAVTLTVTSRDRRLFLRYELAQPDDSRHVVVIGPKFRMITCGGRRRRFRSPQFGTPEAIAPDDVRAMVQWALVPEPTPEEIDYTGKPLAREEDTG